MWVICTIPKLLLFNLQDTTLPDNQSFADNVPLFSLLLVYMRHYNYDDSDNNDITAMNTVYIIDHDSPSLLHNDTDSANNEVTFVTMKTTASWQVLPGC